MDLSTIPWPSQDMLQGLDDPIFTDHDFDFLDPLDEDWAAILDDPTTNASTLLNISNLPAGPERPPPKLRKPNAFSGFSSAQDHHRPTSSPIILNFGPAEVRDGPPDGDDETAGEDGKKADEASKPAEKVKVRAVRANKGPQPYDHIVAERKRREQLSQRFLTLTTIVPGLKKMDKTSVLGDAIKYLKHLQERVRLLEEKTTKKMMESVVLVRKSRANVEADSPVDDQSPGPEEQALPEIEARVCGNQMLIRIHCEKRRGVLANLISQVEDLSLAILNTNVTTFECFALDITIVTEMGKEFTLTTYEVVRRLRSVIMEFL